MSNFFRPRLSLFLSANLVLGSFSALMPAALGQQKMLQNQGIQRLPENPGDVIKEQEVILPGETAAVSAGRQKLRSLPKADGTENSLIVPKGATSPLLKAELVYCVPRGTSIKLKLASVPTHGMHLLDRDLDGKLHPASVNDVVTATVTEDIYVEENKVIPAGTVFKGYVSHTLPPRRVQRPGFLEVSFTELELPDKRRFRFSADANNFKKATMKGVLNATGMVAANAAGGAIVGALGAYYFMGGMRGVSFTHGYNIAGGAAAGALIAAGHAILKRGDKAALEPGDDLNLSINTDLLLPTLTEPTKKVNNNLEGLAIEVGKTKIMNDGLDGHFIRIDVTIDNNSEKKLSAIDLFLRDANGNKYPVAMGPGDDSEYLFTLDPFTSVKTRLFFASEYPKLKHELIWIDHNSRKVCFRQQIQ